MGLHASHKVSGLLLDTILQKHTEVTALKLGIVWNESHNVLVVLGETGFPMVVDDENSLDHL